MNPEKQPRRSRFGRTLSSLALGAGLLALIGDRAHTAGIGGIDPLEVLNLSVKPNVIVVIDSSGSMGENLTNNTIAGTFLGDWPESKMFQAKQVVRQVIQANETKVSFLFGQYTQSGSDFQNELPGQSRFYYTTSSTQSPSMTSNELSLTRTSASDTTGDGHAAWQDIRTGWNTLYYGEQITAVVVVTPTILIDATNRKLIWRERVSSAPYRYNTCTVTLPATLYGTYTDPGVAPFRITDLMAALNTFTVTGGPVVNRTCVRTGGYGGGETSPAADQPTQPLTFVWGGAPSYQVTINKGPFVAPATTANRIQLVRGTGVDETILNDMGFPNSIPNSALAPGSGGSNTTTSTCGSGSGNNWTSCASFTGPNTVGGPSSSVSVVTCAVPVAAQFYQTGPALATALQTGMNACTGRGATPNTYTVTYNGGTGGSFTFATGGGNSFQMRWADTPNNIAGALGSAGTPNTGLSTSSKNSGNSIHLLDRTTADDILDGVGVRHYYMRASRFFNGETFTVLADGTLCNMSAPTPTNPPSITVARVTSCGTAPVQTVTFNFAGGRFSGNTVSCSGFQTKVNLQPCNTAASQFAVIAPFLDRQIPLTPDGLGLSPTVYSEVQDGSWNTATIPPAGPGILADGSTPIANSIDDIRTLFNTLWTAGQNPGPPVLPPISSQSPPQERTIVMFVTDGDDTCSGSGDTSARVAAYSAQQLYDPIVGGVQSPSGFLTIGSNAASSVSTYVVGFGSGASTNRLNWIAWGGSGMTRAASGTPAGWTTSPTAGDRANCATCQDAFIAPDAATLTAALQAIIDQGATAGSFTAQQSIVANVFEMVAEVPGFSPNAPKTRYEAIVPIQFQASFDLPGFQGRLKAIQFDAACSTFPAGDPRCVNTASFAKWEAGQKLLDRVTNGPLGTNGMNQIAPLRTGAVAGQGTFSQLHGGATDTSISGSTAGIKRRIYTTTRNGSFALDSSGPILNANLGGLTTVPISPNRTTLWPPTTTGPSAIAPNDDALPGILDVALGLPTDVQITAGAAAQFAALQATFKACRGVTLPANCLAGAGATAQAKRARREAREMILAFTAGAQFAPDIPGDPARVTAGTEVGEILYKARNWVLAESTLAPPAIVAGPIAVPPAAYKTEYANYADGVSSAGIKQNGVTQGYGLSNPDLDNSTTLAPPTPPIDTAHTATQRAVMTVAYLGANDMLHGFRAGPSCGTPGGVGLSATYGSCAEKGGEELWGFVPFDRLIALKALMQPQTRQNKTYVIGAALRFADVFIDADPLSGKALTASVGGVPVPGGCTDVSGAPGKACGLWRQLLIFGRGPGGKFMTTLDITNRGPYTGLALASQAPIVLWSRGNPDTQDGTAGGTPNNNAFDKAAYDKMGETWSTPAVVYVDRGKNVTARRPFDAVTGAGGVPMVAYMGSGYCSPCNAGEGTTFFTLDVTSGDVVAAVDVELEAAAAGVQRVGLAYANALVSSPAAYSASAFDPLQPGHPADLTTRVYIGDLHGRLWKFLSAAPSQALLMADLGADQPIGTAPALLGLSADGIEPSAPFVFVTSGNDSRATGTFKIFGFKDGGDDTTATYGSATPTADPAVSVYAPTTTQFTPRAFDLPNFRGTIQPATALSAAGLGRVFFGGTRFNLPGSPEAPPPPPCRSSFDTIIFALAAVTGGAAYDLNASGDDAYMVFTNSRKTAIQIIKQPTPPASPPGTKGKGMLMIDEGLMGSGSVQPPPPPGLQPQIPAAPNVGLVAVDAQGNAFPQFTSPRLCQGQ